MDTTAPSQTKAKDSVSVSEFIEITKWVVKITFSINKTWATVSLLSNIVKKLQPIIYTYMFARVLDFVIKTATSQNPDIKSIYPILSILVIYNIIFTVLNFIGDFYTRSLDIKSDLSLQKVFYEKVHSLGIQVLESPEINNQIYRTGSNFGSITRFFDQVSDLVSALVNTVIAMVIALNISPIIVVLIIILAIPKYLIDKKYRRLYWKFSIENTEGRRMANNSAGDLKNPGQLQEIFINNSYSFFDKKFTDYFTWSVFEQIKMRKAGFLKGSMMGFIGDLGLYWGYTIIIKNFFLKLLSIGDLYFQLNILSQLQNNLFRMMMWINNMFEHSVQIKDVYELFQLKPAFVDGNIDLPDLKFGPSIKIEDLQFIYPRTERYVLKGINLDIKPGEKVAIVGHNGAGKTTLVRLLCKMYQPTLGKVSINDIDINSIKAETLHKNMGVLFQDFNTYSHLTAKENIYLGRPNEPINEQKIIDSAKNADAIKFIEELPKGFDNLLTERFKGGVKLSTGQWQKIAIARFFYRNTPFVIFDEPTASIDAESEYNIFNKIYTFFKDKTVIIISHRFSTVRNADRILVLKDGEFVEQGTHSQLLNMEGEYARAFKLQAEGYNIEKLETIA